jgi:NitT/TauT family transport system ATP-binding protein
VTEPAAATREGSIAIESLAKTFVSESSGATVDALHDVDASIQPGEFVALVGPSGCGKSTLLMILAGLTLPSGGRVLIGDRPVTKPRRSVGVMFQTPELFPWRNVIDNVLLPIDIYGWSRKEYARRAQQLLDLVGLSDFGRFQTHELSGGMQQRAALCRLLITDPSVVLMDEPFGSLDELTRERLNRELMRLLEGSPKTVVFVTHNVLEAVFLADRVLVMASRPGRVIADVPVPIERPRRSSVMRSNAFAETVFRIRSLLGLEEDADAA